MFSNEMLLYLILNNLIVLYIIILQVCHVLLWVCDSLRTVFDLSLVTNIHSD